MESAIVRNLEPEFEPVVVVWSDTIPDDTVQFKPGKFGCILDLFAEAACSGKITGGSRESIICPGGRAAIGFGIDFDQSEESLDHYTAILSKGLQVVGNKITYRAKMESVRRSWRSLYEYGERRHCTAELARDWLAHGLPRFNIAHKFVLFKSLSRTAADENIQAIIFLVNPLELAGLITLAGSVLPGTDPVQVPPGADCNRIASFVYAQAEQPVPRAILGMLDVDGRKVMQRRFHKNTISLALPMPLFLRMEQEADNCVFQIPAWRQLTVG